MVRLFIHPPGSRNGLPAGRWSSRALRPGLLGLCAVGLALALGTSALARQGPPFADSSLVQAPNGTLYVVEGGTLHLIRPIPATEAQLAQMPIGDPVTTGIIIIPPVGAPNPCGEALDIRVCVLEVEQPYFGSFPPGAGLEYARIRLRIENFRSAPVVLGSYIIALQVRDMNGSIRDWVSGGNTPEVPEALSGGSLSPGAAREGNAIIAVPAGIPLTGVIWILETNPYQAVEAPIP